MNYITNKLKLGFAAISMITVSFSNYCFADTDLKASQSMRLIQKANTGDYNEVYSFASEKLQNFINKASSDEIKMNKMRIVTQFSEVCGDSDLADDVMVTKIDQNKSNLVFTCFDGYETKSGLSFIFDIDDQKSIVTGFSQIEIIKNENKDDMSAFKLVLKESAALVVSTAASVGAAKAIFTGQHDKPKHAGLSSVISSVVTSAAHHFFKFSPKKSALIGFSVCSVVGVGKEIWDKYHPGHTPDVKDFAADLIGCTAGAVGMSLAIEF